MSKLKFKKLLWNKQFAQAWRKYPPPVRPSKAEQKFYENYIIKTLRRNPKARILILGATPEFRDLILKHGSTPICCELNPEVFNVLKGLMKRRGKEIFIWSDWLKLKDKNKFDLIIGHQVFNMLPLNKQTKLAQTTSQNLKQGGLFIHSVVIRLLRNKKIDILNTFKKYRHLAKKLKKAVSLFSIIYPNLGLKISWQPGNFYTPNQCRDLIEDLYQKKAISKIERNRLFAIIPTSDLKVYVPTKKQIEKTIKRYFQTLSIYYPPSSYYDSHNWPVYVLKKK